MALNADYAWMKGLTIVEVEERTTMAETQQTLMPCFDIHGYFLEIEKYPFICALCLHTNGELPSENNSF